jgi:hypothetical protein
MGYAAKAPIEYQADELAKYLTIPESFRGLVVRLTPKEQTKRYEHFVDLPRYDFEKPVVELLNETRS